ncbi:MULTISPECIES: hypothetical protein [Streptomyces]|uniref:Uncharacterized protein n=1 Tax=Streptomyces mutomycini TaxID=284036 RepID=A0ABW0BD33_9ACTN|nr:MULTISPECIES: hypothetical protein [Streptomyces]KPC79685.1 hypothetical protein ADK82_24550 [Streptomyces sp. NRRL S-4]
MRSLVFSPGPSPGALTPGEVIIILVVVLVAGALALAGLPMFGALEFIAGALYISVRSLKAMRMTAELPSEAV